MFGKQLNITEFFRDCYKTAKSEPFGRLIKDLDSRTSDSMSLSLNKVGHEPNNFLLPSALPKKTPLTNEREKVAYSEVLAKKIEAERILRNFGPL